MTKTRRNPRKGPCPRPRRKETRVAGATPTKPLRPVLGVLRDILTSAVADKDFYITVATLLLIDAIEHRRDIGLECLAWEVAATVAYHTAGNRRLCTPKALRHLKEGAFEALATVTRDKRFAAWRAAFPDPNWL